MATYVELTEAGVTTRTAAGLTGLPRSTTTRRRDPDVPAAKPARANRLSVVERLEASAVLDHPRFVDLPPVQIYATLLDEAHLPVLDLHHVPDLGRAHPARRTPPDRPAPRPSGTGGRIT